MEFLANVPEWAITAALAAILGALGTALGLLISRKNPFFVRVLPVVGVVVAIGFAGPYVAKLAKGAAWTDAQIEANVVAIAPELYGTLKDRLPDAFAKMTTLYGGIVRSGSSPEFAAEQVRIDTPRLRDDYAGIIQSAPDAEISALLAANIAFHKAVLEKGGPDLCGQFVGAKNVALLQAGVFNDYQAQADALDAAFFAAAGAAGQSPVTRSEATPEDQAAFGQALVARQLLPEMLTAIQSGDTANPMLCPGMIEMLGAAATLEGEAGSRIRATLVADYYRL